MDNVPPTSADLDVIRFMAEHNFLATECDVDDQHDAWVMASLAHDIGLPYSPPMGTRDFMLIRAIGPECWGMMDWLESHWWDEYV